MRIRESILAVCLAAAACAPPQQPQAGQSPYFAGASAIAVGRHISIVGGCNDCHTGGYADGAGRTPEADRLKGSPVGHWGPWGTTYASNLRLIAASMTEDQWVETLKTREYRPPMPWYIMHDYDPRDLRALYQYIRSLGEPGEPTPVALPPSTTPPPPPYYDYHHGGPPPA